MAMFHVVPLMGCIFLNLINFAKVYSQEEDFNARNNCLTAKLLNQGYRYHKGRKCFFQVLSTTL